MLRIQAANFVLQEFFFAYFTGFAFGCECCFVLWGFGCYGGGS